MILPSTPICLVFEASLSIVSGKSRTVWHLSGESVNLLGGYFFTHRLLHLHFLKTPLVHRLVILIVAPIITYLRWRSNLRLSRFWFSAKRISWPTALLSVERHGTKSEWMPCAGAVWWWVWSDLEWLVLLDHWVCEWGFDGDEVSLLLWHSYWVCDDACITLLLSHHSHPIHSHHAITITLQPSQCKHTLQSSFPNTPQPSHYSYHTTTITPRPPHSQSSYHLHKTTTLNIHTLLPPLQYISDSETTLSRNRDDSRPSNDPLAGMLGSAAWMPNPCLSNGKTLWTLKAETPQDTKSLIVTSRIPSSSREVAW